MKHVILTLMTLFLSFSALGRVDYHTNADNVLTGSCDVSIGNFNASGTAVYDDGELSCCWDGFANGSTWHNTGCASISDSGEVDYVEVDYYYLEDTLKNEDTNTKRRPRQLIQGAALVN